MIRIFLSIPFALGFFSFSGFANDLTPQLSLSCKNEQSATAIQLTIKRAGQAFELNAMSANTQLLRAIGQRPSLNVKLVDNGSDKIEEFIEFNNQGLNVVPINPAETISLDLKDTDSRFVYKKQDTSLLLFCVMNSHQLLQFLNLEPIKTVDTANPTVVAFDVDDTLLFTTPAFDRAARIAGAPTSKNLEFWGIVNKCAAGCPAEDVILADGTVVALAETPASPPKLKAVEFVRKHQAMGHSIYAITARRDTNGDFLKDYLEAVLGIPQDHTFFEPDIELPGNSPGKTDRMAQLGVEVFYGDADSDITDALKVESEYDKMVVPFRFLRSPRSSNRKAGQLNKYHPGYYGEKIIKDSY